MSKLIEIRSKEYQDKLEALKRRPDYKQFVKDQQAQIAGLVAAGAINPANESDFSELSEALGCQDESELQDVFGGRSRKPAAQ